MNFLSVYDDCPPIAVDPLLVELFKLRTPVGESGILQGVPLAIGCSGGGDSGVLAHILQTAGLNMLGHQGPRLLIHSDLGRIEWRDSGPMCERMASMLGLELVVVHRQAGDLVDRWLVRWESNVQRYAALECVKLILPWSTAAMRFCTSELKTAIICRELVRRFPGQVILSPTGIRHDESFDRRNAPVLAIQKKLENKTLLTSGYTWNPLVGWTREDILRYHQRHGIPRHEAYEVYGSSRVSCSFCVLSSIGNLLAAASCEENHDVYRELCAIEIRSTFSFQSTRWLGDVAPHLLSEQARAELEDAKSRAAIREEAEALLPKSLLYVKGWPVAIPTWSEAELLAEVRVRVAQAVGIVVGYTDPASIIERYRFLMEEQRRKQEQQALEQARRELRQALKKNRAATDETSSSALEIHVQEGAPCLV